MSLEDELTECLTAYLTHKRRPLFPPSSNPLLRFPFFSAVGISQLTSNYLTMFKRKPKIYRKLPATSFEPVQVIGAKDAHFEEVFGTVDFGSASSTDYRPWYPTKEIQSYGDCLTFSCLNTLEIICNRLMLTDDDGRELNLSEIDLAVGAGTSQHGNSFNNVAERLRKVGVVQEKWAPYTRVWEERQGIFNAIPPYAKRYGKGTGHAWVKTDRNSLKNAMNTAPLWIGVGLGDTYQTHAGTEQDPIPKPRGYSVYHGIVLGYVNDNGLLYTLDNYSRSEVVYAADYPVLFAKLLDPRGLPEGWQTKNVEGKRMFDRLAGKWILRAEAQGQLYFCNPDTQKLEYFDISNVLPLSLRDKFLLFLKASGLFTGVTEASFALLEAYTANS